MAAEQVNFKAFRCTIRKCSAYSLRGSHHKREEIEEYHPEVTLFPVTTIFPTSSDERKLFPVVTGLLDYFPRALAAVAHLSLVANDQHNPDEPLHWAREKSSDHLNTMLRHFMERRGVDTDGERHTTKAAWRMLALLELELEEVE